MKKRSFALSLALVSALAPAFGQAPAANHLVLSEIGAAAPASSEFTEIYNPTGAAINLSNYYLSDHNLYFDLPSVVAGNITNTLANGSDHLVKMPNITIPSGGVVVVCYQATSFLNVYFDGSLAAFTGLPGSPQLVEVNESMAEVPNISANYNRTSPEYPLADPATPATSGNNLNHTDTDENVVLFYWDGTSSLVQDLDIVQWRAFGNPWGASTNQTANKSFITEQGPSAVQNTYALDAGGSDNLTVNFPEASEGEVSSGNFIRHSLIEPGETHTGGNGLTGDDESLEQVNLSWKIVWGSSSNGSPGVVDLGLSSQNQPPVVGVAKRDTQFPTPGQTVTITCPVYDEGTPSVKLMVAKGNTTFAPTTMTNSGNGVYTATISTSGLADGTLIRYYVTATDSGNLTAREQDQTFRRHSWPGHHIFSVKTGAYDPNSIIVSEVMYNPQGTNNYTHSQYLELYNPANTPLDISGFVLQSSFTDTEPDGSTPPVNVPLPPNIIFMPEGTVIPAKGYIVVAGQEAVLRTRYPGMDLGKVVDVDIEPGKSFIGHNPTTIWFFGPNNFDFDTNPVDTANAFKAFTYENNTNGWPQGSTSATPPNTTAGNTGYSIELTSLVPGSENTGSNWAVSKFFQGSPLAPNSVDTTLRPGDVAVTQPVRNIVNPTPSDALTISADVTSTNPITNVTLWYSENNGVYLPVAMVPTTGNTYTAAMPTLSNNALIKYYVQATDSAGYKGTYPPIAPVAVLPFRVESVSSTNSIKINEIMFNPAGTDNKNYPEYYELYNSGSSAVDLSYFMYGTQLRIGNNQIRLVPEGTILPPHQYIVLAGRKSHFDNNYLSPFKSTTRMQWGEINGNLVIGNSWEWGTSVLGNSGTTVRIFHPNNVDYSGNSDSTPFINFAYGVTAPWPGGGGNKGLELKDLGLDPTAGGNWAFSIPYNGTPQTRNSVAPPPSHVGDWNLY